MSMQVLRSVLCTLPTNLNVPHPMAKEGNWHDFVRANDKKRGEVCHYANKHGLFFVFLKNAA